MAGPTTKTPFAVLPKACLFTECVAAVTPGAQDLAPLMADMRTKLLSFNNELEGKDENVTRKRAMLTYQNGNLDRLVMTIAADAHAADRHNPAANAVSILFPTKTPSEIIKPKGAGLGAQLADCRNILPAFGVLPELPELQALRGMKDSLETAITDAGQALTEVETAIAERRAVRLRIPGLRENVRQVFERFYGQLLERFPRQKDFIDGFFLPAEEQHAATEPDEPPPPAKGAP